MIIPLTKQMKEYCKQWGNTWYRESVTNYNKIGLVTVCPVHFDGIDHHPFSGWFTLGKDFNYDQ